MANTNTARSAESRRSIAHSWVLYLLALIFIQCCIHLLFLSCTPLENSTTSGSVDTPPMPMPMSANASASTTSVASRQSFGFFYDVTDDHWNLLRRIYRDHSNHLNPERPLQFNPENEDKRGIETWGDPEMFSSYKAWYQSNYEPNFSCQFEKRVGDNMNGDGPKWVCDPHRIRKLAADRKSKDPSSPGCVVYSVGSSGSFVFEMGMQKEMGKGVCEYHIFDYGDYEKRVPKELEGAHYHKWGLQKQEANDNEANDNETNDPTPGKTFYGLQDTIKLLNHEDLDVIDVFKIDCEKCEWETYSDWLADDVGPMLHQILVEVHGAPGRTAVDFFDSLERSGYLRFHKEPNIQYNPGCVEYAFVKVETSFMDAEDVAVDVHGR